MGIKIKEIKEKHTVSGKGKTYGAFENDVLAGICAIDNKRFGSKKQYVELTQFQISLEKQGTGVEKRLFETALSVAASFNAGKLYISGDVAEEQQAFFQSLGCKRAEEQLTEGGVVKDVVSEEHTENREERTYALECDTGLRQSSNMSLGMCIGLCLGIPFGLLLFDNIGVGMCLGMAVGMCFGLASGSGFDLKKLGGKEPTDVPVEERKETEKEEEEE